MYVCVYAVKVIGTQVYKGGFCDRFIEHYTGSCTNNVMKLQYITYGNLHDKGIVPTTLHLPLTTNKTEGTKQNF